MATYHQMGNDSSNLIFDLNLSTYRGSIISPVNADEVETKKFIGKAREKLRSSFDIVFDPQLYSPRSERGCLPKRGYFPKDVDTADVSGLPWWQSTVDKIIETAEPLAPNAICSPAMVPKSFADGYYEQVVQTSDYLLNNLKGSATRCITTAIVSLKEIAMPSRVKDIASILSRPKSDELFLVLVGEKEPRREYQDTEELKGAMTLIRKLEESGMRVLVGFCSTDVLLWKDAGATACATGKFFNLRRFTISRFDEPKDGGGQISYWMEEALLAFVRQTDLLRLQQRDMLSEASKRNPYMSDIISAYTQGKAWIALSWKQYMWWFADIEQRLSLKTTSAKILFEAAEANWLKLDQMTPRLLLEERLNDGSWIRQWMRAIEELPYFAS